MFTALIADYRFFGLSALTSVRDHSPGVTSVHHHHGAGASLTSADAEAPLSEQQSGSGIGSQMAAPTMLARLASEWNSMGSPTDQFLLWLYLVVKPD